MRESSANTVGNDLATGDGHVVQADQSTPDLRRRNFRNVERDNHSRRSDAKANDQAPYRHLSNAVCSTLQDCTDCEEGAADVDGDLASVLIRSETGDDGTNEGAAGAERGDQFFFFGRGFASVEVGSEVDEDGGDDTCNFVS